MSEPSEGREYEKTKPEDTDFRQQRLRAWQPLLIPKFVILTFFIMGIIMLPLGFVMFHYSNEVVELETRYDNLPCTTPGVGPCIKTVSFTIPEDMDGPIYFYYKLTNFYQNHRRYIKSRSDSQLQGDATDTSGCDPLESYQGKNLYPCGLVASSVFTDTFVGLSYPDTTSPTPIPISSWRETGIAWESDTTVKFVEKFPGQTTLPDNLSRTGPFTTMPELTDEHLMVWMRSAAWPTFKKLYAIIDDSLYENNKIDIVIEDSFDSQSYGGEKYIVLSTATWLGGKNVFLGWAYIVAGSFAFFMVIVMSLKQCIMPRKLGDMSSVLNIDRIRKVEPGHYD